MEEVSRGKYQMSLRSLLLLTALLAVFLTPLVWVSRERQQMLETQEALLRAREVALRSVVLEATRRRPGDDEGSQPPLKQISAQLSNGQSPATVSRVEQLKAENNALKAEVDSLKRQLKALKFDHNE
jgi:hypothetical protein